ncbi:LOW QUALITY PROTEIN: phospholipase B1, membrane-associated [Cochliomyia hominivorax]
MQNLGKLQRQRSRNESFPCSLNKTRSLEPPSSVHRLRPGDIDIIGAIGDSLTAGTAMMSKFYFLFTEFRGQTVLGGGLKDWRSILTLPNILKEFNPNLYGYAVANTLAKYHGARFNVAEAFALTEDMPYMAEVLVKRMQRDPKVDMAKHWKMVSIFIGANDVCNQLCYYDNMEDFLTNHTKNLHKTLTILRDNIPRLMVNVLPIPDIDDILHKTQVSDACDTLHKISCPCLIGNSITSKQLQERHKILKRFQQIDIDVASLPEFQREDFAAVPRSLTINKTLRNLKNGRSDLRYFAIDCFHFSQYGNAAFATMLWNDILQVKTKPTNNILRPFEIFICPTEEQPYISTLSNN